MTATAYFLAGVWLGALLMLTCAAQAESLSALAEPKSKYTTDGWNMPTNMTTQIAIWFRTPEQINKLAHARGFTDETLAFSYHEKKTCVIVVPPLNDIGDAERIRHEVRHCLEGAWHQ